jgi:hypothetical protein
MTPALEAEVKNLRKLYDAGIPLVPVIARAKFPVVRGWNGPGYDPSWESIEEHIRKGGNVGMRTGRACRLPPPYHFTVSFDFDPQHFSKQTGSELRKKYREVLDVVKSHAIYFGGTPNGGYTAIFVSREPYLTNVKLVGSPKEGGSLVEVYGVGEQGEGRLKLLPPSWNGVRDYTTLTMNLSPSAMNWWDTHPDAIGKLGVTKARSLPPQANLCPICRRKV